MLEERQCFRVKDANGFSACSVPHREDLHGRPYQYADQIRGEADRKGNLPAAGPFEEATGLRAFLWTNVLSHRVL